MSAEQHRTPHAPEQRLREDIDSGNTGDKVDASDPAVVPLGTDAEAGGVSTDAGAASRARQDELDGVKTPRRRDRQYALILPGFVLLVAALLAFVLLR
ncbi:hypothetical protein PZ897_14490 [Hoeflea sp. YIM 152468]|uniref:hypothetical protein n=1 Tax=Hoeflea sp. YIM 152468 TaxID=3031759 RepID=UPI0023DC158D|nr:hypothetical protein [Hoeflea sp. YIM 152468]MDF1609390.1 hypothetical protein [Hoeflea sp. YIM 152468]